MVHVDVFGIREEAPASSCSCGGACGSVTEKPMGEMYEDLIRFFQESDLATDVGLHFIDVFEDDLKGYDTPSVRTLCSGSSGGRESKVHYRAYRSLGT